MLQQVLDFKLKLINAIISLFLHLNTALVFRIKYQMVQTKTFLKKIYKKDGKELILGDRYENLKKHRKGGDKRK